MYIYAHINKNTLRFVREQKAISFDYVTRITKFKEDKLTLWESNDSGKFPTINQAKTIAKCYRIPFAGLYMNAQDINIKHLPKMRNLRSLPNAIVDNSALNLAIADVLSARELLLESKKALKETVAQFNMSINCPDDNVAQWAGEIRRTLGIDSNVQYKCRSARQLYLYIRNLAEAAGAFVHCFTGVDTEIVRGFAIYEDLMPIIGLNNDDRYPAKTFSIIHELVHLIKRSSAVCNDMTNSLSLQAEEVFCNAVAGAVLVPTVNLSRQLGEYTHDEIDLDVVSPLADKFSISKEVIKKWYTGLHGIILPIDDEVQENVKKVVTSNPQLIDFKQIKSSGDAFLIATAMKYGLTIITEESKKGEKKIPYVCQKLNVPCVDILGLCEKEKWQF